MAVVPWQTWKNFKSGDMNPLGGTMFGDFYDPDVPIANMLAQLFKDRYNYDILSGTGPYRAVVLKVLSGPQVKQAPGDALNNTKEPHAGKRDLPNINQHASIENGGPGAIRVIAKCPELSPDLPWPVDINDERIISLYPEFTAQRTTDSDNTLAMITEGSLIHVDFINKQTPNTTGGNGILLGLVTRNFITKIKKTAAVIESFRDQCKLPKICTPSETKSLYAGNTVYKFEHSGPLIRRVKGKIKTGMYGNGSSHTKVHFDACLQNAEISFKHKLPGPAPDSANAFIWIGHLNGNGYNRNDPVDRPALPRETIIYASKMLDVTSPIEIKYYLHDAAGFGHSWLNGPETTIEEARNNATNSDNDFREKIAPAIKDLLRDGRNIVLVIPEMIYSRGFGTSDSDPGRIDAYSKYDSIGAVAPGTLGTTEVVRVNPTNEQVIASVSSYIQSVSANNQSYGVVPLLSSSPDRFLRTFLNDANIGLLHNNVLDVLETHISKDIKENVGYISILADGMGAASLAAMASNPASGHLSNLNPQRIDYIENGYDRANTYGIFPPSGDTVGIESIPSYYFYKRWLRADLNRSVEFNYIVKYDANYLNNTPETPSGGVKEFFRAIAKESDFNGAFFPASSGIERKLSFHLEDNENNLPYLSLYIGADDHVGHTLSMVNGQLGNFIALKPGHSIGKVGLDYTPNHAARISSKQKAAATAGHTIEKESIDARIVEFESILLMLSAEGLDSICQDVNYKLYCSSYETQAVGDTAILNYGENSLFLSRYRMYLQDKQSSSMLNQLIIDEAMLIEISNDMNLINQKIDEYNEKKNTVETSPAPISQALESMSGLKTFNPNMFNSENSTNNIDAINSISYQIGTRDAVDKTLERLRKKSETASSECSLPEVCRKKQITMGSYNPSPTALNITSDPAAFNCDNIKVGAVGNFTKVSEWIQFYPKKEDFTFDGEMTVHGKASKTNTGIEDKAVSFEMGKFKYRARRAGGTVKQVESPNVWKCLSQIFQGAWTQACDASKYVPFFVTEGIRGSNNSRRVSATQVGLHVGSLGLCINVDPFLASYQQGSMSHSVFTGAWTAGIGDNEELYNMGVFESHWSANIGNIYQGSQQRRKVENLLQAPTILSERPDKAEEYYNNFNIGNLCKDNDIVPAGANPTEWVITFCEKSGAKWANGSFLKRKQNGGAWLSDDKARISEIYGIPNVVDRVKNISWSINTYDVHSCFLFWTGSPIIPWPTISGIAAAKGVT